MTARNKLFDPDLPGEIAPGLALHLDPDRLLAEGASFTGDSTFRVQGEHIFLCIEAGRGSSRWAPLFTNANTGRVPLPKEGRAGHPNSYDEATEVLEAVGTELRKHYEL